ncbi:protein phosphatase 2C domain-containing protein [Halobium salinum]|uniref:Protein phosphatase 2C domain-containing protein n=1 Tax=Halobium salinum TaxID=1364940 RepID=A0ABD5PFJ7_9EURY|nr:protein phosphatase 2C domain-containing protein [Halobium salinum]
MMHSVEIDCEHSTAVSDDGWGANEDIVTIQSESAWVLDGATGLGDINCTPCESDGQWYVTQFNEYLKNHIRDTDSSLEGIVNDGIRDTAQRFARFKQARELDDAHLPSATCAICRIENGVLDVFVLGDCSILIGRNNELFGRVYDSRIDPLDADVAHQMQTLVQEEGLSVSEARMECLPLLRANRRKKNKPGGYWALGMEPAASAQGLTRRYTLEERDVIYGMTDGFSALVDTYDQFMSWEAALGFLEQSGLEEGVEKIRQAEKDDPKCLMYPRTKPADDSTAFRAPLMPGVE